MNFRYFKGKHLTLKPYLVIAMLIITVQAAKAQDYGNIEFVENKGQWDSRVKYRGLVDAGAVFIRPQGFTILQHNKQDLQQLDDLHSPHSDEAVARIKAGGPIVVRSHSWNVDFIGASPNMQVVPDKVIKTYNNYFLGNDQSKWAANCRIFQAVTLKDVYPNIDVRYYTNNGTLKYDILVKPGGKVSNIALKYDGLDKIQVKNKELVLNTTLGEMKESSPYTFQGAGKERKEINCKYVVKDNIVRFDVKGYDPNSTLVIDPTLVFCSFSGSTNDNWGFTATYGPDGALFGGGIARLGNGFPVSPGAFQTTWGGGSTGSDGAGPNDIGIIKLSPDGSSRVYATYLGGSGNEQPHSLVVDPQGNLIVAGRTNSSNYPTTGTGLIGTGGGYDIVITKLNAAGSALIGSKKIGGTGDDGVNINPSRGGRNSLQHNYGDDGRSEVIVDGGGSIYVASATQSNNFPVTAGVFQGTFGGGLQDGVLLKFNATLSTQVFSSYLGGDGSDAAYVLSLGATGDIYVAGGTESNAATFPGNHAGTIGAANNGGIDGYVAQVTNNGAAIIRSTFIGTGNYDQVYGIQFDRNGFPYIMGQTEGNMPAINATFSNPGAKQFIAKLQPDLSAYVYRTTFGTSNALPNISPIAFLVDRCENVYVSGWGGCIACPPQTDIYRNAGTNGMPITADALDPTTDGNDLYFFVLKKDAVSQLYGSFFGQSGGFTDHVDGGTSRFDANGVVYQAVCANCGGGAVFPTTAGSWASVKPASALCNLGMIKMSFNLAGVGADIQSEIGGVIMDTAGCVPLTVTFTDLIQNAQSYIWNFGDGPDTPELPAATGYTQQHTYNSVGTYQVMLVAIDPASCNLRDTSYLTIRVGDIQANVDFNAVKIGACTSFQYQFNNTSTAPPIRPFTDTSFVWTFSDAPNSPVIAGLNPVTHTFPGPGTYTVILTLRDTGYCNYPDADTLQLSVASNVEAIFDTPDRGCVPYSIVLDNNSIAGETWEWDFGDLSGTSTDFEPTYTYNTPGTYTIRLVARNPNTCNVTDTAYRTITVYPIPTAAFVVNPLVPVENSPHTFTNQSSPDATSFKWIWGDGDSLLTTSRAPVQHQYNATGTFTACLVAFNDAGCSDTVCTDVRTIITPVVDVPNAFTPNSGDINSRVMVRGFGIAKMRFIIWNRWGQKVFETGNRFEGWDGKVKGQVQPMDVYAFTLDVEFFDGTKATRKGDITLIR